MKPQSRLYTFGVLCRIATDSSILAKPGALFALQEAIAELIDSITPSNLEQESADMIDSACAQTDPDSHPQKRQLLMIFPAFTPRLSDFRQRLAVRTLVQDSSHLHKQTNPLNELSDFTLYLRQDPRFAIQPRTDYPWLTATIAILDIALASGHQPQNIALDREVEREFNERVDELAKTVKDMFTKILDTGASHMTRTEAKEVLEALHARLEYAVRMRPRQKVSLFGDLPGVESRAFMKRFLGKEGGG